VLPRVEHLARSVVEPVDAKAAFLALAPSGVTQVPGDRDATFAHCAALSRRLPAFRLRLGTDPAEVNDTLLALIERIGI
jgi:hypothetical protein